MNMNIYECKSTSQYYKIVKYYYQQQQKVFDIHKLTLDDCSKIYNILMEQLGKSSMFDFTFVKSYLIKCKYYYHILTDLFSCFVISMSALSKKDLNNLFKTVSRIQTVIRLYNMNNKLFRFFIVMNPSKRYMPASGMVKTKNINGGFTYINGRDIFIIRKEDYEKVVLHELLHHNTIIHNENWKSINIARLKDYFHIHPSYQLIPNEAVIETIACLLHICFVTIEKKDTFRHIYSLEKKHSIQTAKKIIQYQNNKLWNEETNAYAYTVLKNILFCNFDKFLKIFDFKHYNDDIITGFMIDNYKKHNKHQFITDKSLKLTSQ